jgi:hypothetical protein
MRTTSFTEIMSMALEHRSAVVVKSSSDRFLTDQVDADVPITVGAGVAFIKVRTFIRESIGMYEQGPQFCLNFIGYTNVDGSVTLLDGVNRAKSKNYLKIECSSIMTELDLVCLVEDKFDAWEKFVTKKNKSKAIPIA